MPNFQDPRAKIDYGYDFNFFQKLAVANSSFNDDCDIIINMKAPTYTVTFQIEGTGSDQVQYSFNGTTIHGDMIVGKSSASLVFENRVISKIWFKTLSGSPTVRVEAWAIR